VKFISPKTLAWTEKSPSRSYPSISQIEPSCGNPPWTSTQRDSAYLALPVIGVPQQQSYSDTIPVKNSFALLLKNVRVQTDSGIRGGCRELPNHYPRTGENWLGRYVGVVPSRGYPPEARAGLRGLVRAIYPSSQTLISREGL